MLQDQIREIFKYDAGDLIWGVPPRGTRKMGEVAGGLKKDSKTGKLSKEVMYQGKKYNVGRLVYTLFNGTIPDGMRVSYLDDDATNTRIENLILRSPSAVLDNSYTIGVKPPAYDNKTETVYTVGSTWRCNGNGIPSTWEIISTEKHSNSVTCKSISSISSIDGSTGQHTEVRRIQKSQLSSGRVSPPNM